MVQAAFLNGFAFYTFPCFKNCWPVPEVNVGGRQIFQALVIAAVVIVIDEGGDLCFKVTRHVVMLQQGEVESNRSCESIAR